MQQIAPTLATLSISTKPLFLGVTSLLLLTITSACGRMHTPQIVTLQVTYDEQVVGCDKRLQLAENEWRIDAFKWYFSALEILYQQSWQPLKLAQSKSQHSGVVLFENDQCKRRQLQLALQESVDWQQVSAIRFRLGLPFGLNHDNPLKQPEPMNRSDMFWSWQSGHKFLRADLRSDDTAWSFHLGSIGCAAASAMRSPTQQCKQPNLFDYQVNTYHRAGTLTLHLEQLLHGVQINSANSCRFHGMQEQSCAAILENLADNSLFSWQ